MRGRIRIAIACAGLLATSVARAGAQTTYRETGSVTVGGYVVWVRGTSANLVQLFVGRGFRDAFAQAHEMDAAKLQQWIDSVRAVAPLPENDTSAVDASLRGSTIGEDVTMLRRVGGPFSGLRLLVRGEDPITMAEPTARDLIAALDSAAHAAHALTPASVMAHMLPGDAPVAGTAAVATTVAVAPPAVAKVAVRNSTPAAIVVAAAPVAAVTVAAAPVAAAPVVAAPVVVAPVAAAPVVAARVVTAPVVTAPVVAAPVVVARAVPAPAPDSTIARPAPELVLPRPSEPVIQLASRVEIMPLPLPKPVVPAAPVYVPAVAAAPVTVVPPHPEAPADKLIHTPLGPFTIPGALLTDRDKQAQYCYTQLGLKYNPDLTGEITMRLAVGSDGTVADAVVTKRNWQGISAGEVESCVRALAHDWTFPLTDPSVTIGAKLLTFSFAPQVASAP